MRKLVFKDAVTIIRIIGVAGIETEIAEAVGKFELAKNVDVKDETKKEIVGKEILETLVQMLIKLCMSDKSSHLIYTLLADVFETKKDEVENMELEEIYIKFEELIQTNDMVNFSKRVGQLRNLK